MRIKSIRLAWFRGAADPVELEAASKSIVVYGANGAGKSSFVDAIEYVIKDGKVGHLAHEYSGRYQEKAIPNTHTPTEQQTKISITFANGTDLTVKIYPKGIPSLTRDNAINMSTWDYRRIVLRQDEVAEFIRSTKGDKYSALLPLLGLHELEIGADNLRQLAKAIEEHSKLKEKLGFLRQTLTKRKEVFSDGTDKAIEKRVSEVHAKYCTGVFEAQEYVAGCKELETTLSQRIGQLSSEERRHIVLQSIANTDIVAGVTSVRGFDTKLAGSVEPLILEKLEGTSKNLSF